MRVLVTGASGLIGGRLIEALSRDGTIYVRAASRFLRSWPMGIEGIIVDWGSPQRLLTACDGMDAVVNLASMSEAECAADPEGALRVNAGGTLALVRQSVQAHVSRFVQLSTSKVYGRDPSGPVTEGTLTRPCSHYAITHRAAEDYAAQRLDAVVLRLANGFGAPVDFETPCWGIIVNDFCWQAVTTGRIAVRSDGLAWRNFVPLDDVVVVLRAAVTALPSGTYNLGAPESMTLRAMADRVAVVCERVLGFHIQVSVEESIVREPTQPLDYRSDRLKAAGLALDASIDDEIARTLVAAGGALGRTSHD